MRRILFLALFVALYAVIAQGFQKSRFASRSVARSGNFASQRVTRSRVSTVDEPLSMSSINVNPDGASSPGNPVIKEMNKNEGVAKMEITLSGEATQKAFTKSCDLFNEEVKNRGYTAAGFRKGAKLPPAYLYQMFGEDRVKLLCGNLMSEEIQDECEKTKLLFVGRGRIVNFNADSFTSGKPHTIEIECDLWPEISYGSGYKGLQVTATKVDIDTEKYDAVKKNIKERYKELSPTEAGYAAQMGDVIVANMNGFEKNPDGSRGAALQAVASGDSVEIVMETGKFMEGLVEGVVGAKAGDTREVTVKFPVRPSGPGAALSGKEALFEIDVQSVNVKTLPAWDEKLADRIREGMTLAELEDEVRQAIDGEAESGEEVSRNDGIAKALLEITTMNKIPESLVEENTRQRFQQMLMDFSEQGSTDEQLQEMSSEESYNRYKEISRENVNKVVILGMAFRDIAEKEGISVSSEEIQEQLDGLNAQAKQRKEAPPDPRAASEEIMNTLLRRKVFNMLAEHATITWVEPPEAPADA